MALTQVNINNWTTISDRIRELMEASGYPQSHSVYHAMQQIAKEIVMDWESKNSSQTKNPTQGMVPGDYVEKYTGEARWMGRIVSVYDTLKGGRRCVVEVFPQHFQIATLSQLRPCTSAQIAIIKQMEELQITFETDGDDERVEAIVNDQTISDLS